MKEMKKMKEIEIPNCYKNYLTYYNNELITEILRYLNENVYQLPEEYKVINSYLEIKFKNNKVHSDDSPAMILHKSGKKNFIQIWYKDDKIHRDEGPAYITKYKKVWYKDDKIHRDDGPAVIKESALEWYKMGKLHRIGKPAFIGISKYIEEKHKNKGYKILRYDGKKYIMNTYSYYEDGLLHRLDGPAIVVKGNRAHIIFYIRGKIHRDNGPAGIYKNGDKLWYKMNNIHRDDGPAIIDGNGRKEWYFKHQAHRLDGPAVIDGNKKEWWIEDFQLSEEEFNKYINLIENYRLKLMKKYFNRWYLSCDYYGTLIYKKNMENSINSIMEMYENV